MTLTRQALDNADLDVKHIEALATSDELTATDRKGQTKKTWAGIVAELSAAATILLSRMWATKTDGPVADGEYSAKYYSQAAAASDASAGLHEAGAASQAGIATNAANNAQASSRTATTWTVLSGWTAPVEGTSAEVLDADAGTHLQASATGYDGVSVPNAGRYYWSAGWGRWVWISATGLAGKADKAAALLTSGDVFSTLGIRSQALDGATAIVAGTTTVGFTIPSSQRGRQSYISADIPATSLRGKTIKILQRYSATAGYPLSTSVSASVWAESRAGAAITGVTPISTSRVQTGTEILQTVVLVVPADSDYIAAKISISNSANAVGSSCSIQVAGVSYQITSGATSITGDNDANLDVRLAVPNAAIAAVRAYADGSMLTSGEMWGTAAGQAGTGGTGNGGVLTTNGGGVTNGFSIPANSGNGGTTYFTGWMSATGLAGKQIDITTVYTTSSGFLTDTVRYMPLVLQIRRSTGNVNVSEGSGVTSTATQNGTTLTIVSRYTVNPADIDIGVCYYVAGGYPTRTYDRSLALQSMSYLVVPATGRTRNDAMLETFVKSAIAQAAADAAAGYSVVLTVKPSGGQYTHPKLALDAITDASSTRRYKIAVYPGTYTAYAEWHTKDWVDIVGIGRREEIVISYANPNDATATTIRNTSLLWLDTWSTLRNLTLAITNGRYVIHLETGGLKPGIETRLENCVITHNGNAAAVNNDWNFKSQYAVGSGNSAGQKIVLRGSTMTGPGGGFSYHTPNNGVAYTAPTVTDAEGCKFVSTSTDTTWKAAFSIKPICVGAGDECRLAGNTFVGDVHYSSTEWLDTADTTSNRAQVHVWGFGNTGFNWVNLCTGPAATYTPAMT